MSENKKKYFTQNTLSRQILLSFAGLAVVLVGLVGYSLVQLNWVSQDQNHLLEVSRPTQTHIYALKNALTNTNSTLQNLIIYSQAVYEVERENIWDRQVKQATDSLARYEGKWTNLDDRIAYNSILSSMQKLRRYQKNVENSLKGILPQEINKKDKVKEDPITADTTAKEKTDNKLQEKKGEKDDTKEGFNSEIAFATTDNEITIEGLDMVLSSASETEGTETNIDIFATDSSPTLNINLTEDTKTLYQKQVAEYSQRIIDELDKLYRSQQQQILYESTQINSKNNQLKWVGGVLLLGLLALMYVLSQRILTSIKTSIKKIQNYTSELNQGNIPVFNGSTNDEMAGIVEEIKGVGMNMLKIKELANKIGSGEFQTDIAVFDNQGEIGASLSAMRDGLRLVAEKDQTRNWANEGFALFAEILRDTESVQKLYDKLTQNLVKYVNANQGGLYIANADEEVPFLELKSCYAYDKKRFVQQKIYIGQGLVGQCWQEGQTMYLLKVPQNYINIASGLGQESPRSLLIVPIKVNDEVYGVIELASFEQFTEIQKTFLEGVAEDIASEVSSLRTTEKTNFLLAESRSITELMSVQEEEMKRNMYQLATTREQLEKRTADLEAMMGAINRATLIMEYDKNGNFINVNDKFLEVSGFEQKDIIGQHRSICQAKDADPAEANMLWAKILNGNYSEQNIKNVRQDGTVFWLHTYLFPVMDSTNTLIKVTCIASDITDKIARETKAQEEQKNIGFKNAALEHAFLVLETDANFIVKNINAFTEKQLEYAPLELKGKHIDEVIIGRVDFKEMKRKMVANEIDEGMVMLKTHSKGFRYVSFVVAGTKNNNKLDSIFFIGTDVTEHQKRENLLQSELQLLEKTIAKLTGN